MHLFVNMYKYVICINIYKYFCILCNKQNVVDTKDMYTISSGKKIDMSTTISKFIMNFHLQWFIPAIKKSYTPYTLGFFLTSR